MSKANGYLVPDEVQWAVKWEPLSEAYPERIDVKATEEAAREAIAGSAFPGVVVSREVSPWQESS